MAFPRTTSEFSGLLELDEVLQWGSLPSLLKIEAAEDRNRYLNAYARTYLFEEVWNEQLVRNLDPFRKFLEVAAQDNGAIVNYSKIGADVAVDHKTVQRYYQILDETLVGFFLEPYSRSVRKSQRRSPKFHFFDCGVVRALQRSVSLAVAPQSYEYGKLFESFVIQELHRRNIYAERDAKLSYFQTTDGAEIDLVIDRPGMPLALVEIKSSSEVLPRHVAHLNRLGGEFGDCERICIARESRIITLDGVTVVPWQQAAEFRYRANQRSRK
jgi:uncharacterized protein